MRAVSRTATVVTLWRAIESSRPPSIRLFEDPLASAWLGWRLRWALRLSRLPRIGQAWPWSLVDGHQPGSRGTVAVRTRYIDDLLARALGDGVRQVVILGAGFDSRAYRVPGIERAHVFELDHPATQTEKRATVTRCLGTLPSHVTLIPIDLITQSLEVALQAVGYRRGPATFVICEGVTHYLPAPVVDGVFHWLAAGTGPGSQMVFTYIHRGILDGTVTFPGSSATLAAVRRAGEPYTFGFDPETLPAYLETHRLALIEDLGAQDYRDRYLRPRGREREPLSAYQRAALVARLA